LEFKYIKRGKRKPSKKRISSLVAEAKEELDRYEQDELIQNYIKDGLKLQRVVIVFWGWEMVYCKVG
jgi:hypothetical protein